MRLFCPLSYRNINILSDMGDFKRRGECSEMPDEVCPTQGKMTR